MHRAVGDEGVAGVTNRVPPKVLDRKAETVESIKVRHKNFIVARR
jgi:hypothetical protein